MRRIEVKNMAQSQVLEGTWEELKLHEQELAGKRFRLVPVPPEPVTAAPKACNSRQSTLHESHDDGCVSLRAAIDPSVSPLDHDQRSVG